MYKHFSVYPNNKKHNPKLCFHAFITVTKRENVFCLYSQDVWLHLCMTSLLDQDFSLHPV